ncbi:MAG: winged helix-turn-helix domain-containing protein [Xanthobacteraceae bacterium]|nr:winged helix-turn-helix domain-containing protein [Xanthobacteraceae bacterium]
MKTGPDFTRIGALVGDPARANMLTALLDGRALTAGELARHAGITPQTASTHLARLEAGGLLSPEAQGRHRYYRLRSADVAAGLEALLGLAAHAGHFRTRSAPTDPAMRMARVCYDHLAGDRGVQMFDHLTRHRLIAYTGTDLALTPRGRAFVASFGISPGALGQNRRPQCRACLDWSVRRHHLAGALGAAMLERLFALRWARREPESRVVRFTPRGTAAFDALFAGGRAAAVRTASRPP